MLPPCRRFDPVTEQSKYGQVAHKLGATLRAPSTPEGFSDDELHSPHEQGDEARPTFVRRFQPGPCVGGCDVRDNVDHGFVECPAIATLWRTATVTLRAFLGSPREPPLDKRDLVLGWPELRMPTHLRRLLLLWRTLMINIITTERKTAIGATISSPSGESFLVDWATIQTNINQRLRLSLAKTLFAKYQQVDSVKGKAAFAKQWFEGGKLFTI